MPIWVTAIIIPAVIALANIATLFFFKWVPEVENQKRYLKRAGFWVMGILTVGAQGTVLYFLSQPKGGVVTPRFVVSVALAASGAVFCAILIVYRRWILGGLMESSLDVFGRLIDNTSRQSDNFGWLLKFTDRHVAETERHEEALRLLSCDPNLSAETVQALRALLNGQLKTSEAPGVPTEAALSQHPHTTRRV